jgi:magnesium chelatase family protein
MSCPGIALRLFLERLGAPLVPGAAHFIRLAAHLHRIHMPHMHMLQLSARSMHRILRVARTIADLAGSADILGLHVAEAISYRRVERVVTARMA